ncbi:DUF418 domain-containing protein [Rhodococcoides fascians]|uniref:DUF418 domain-containing protein n=1 Tax=Rhodococcoides fascians TaxID=1828 RepID=UPI0024B8EFBC|nr:DUF418 domain-containing protein [Rhodococcus fascians]MDJ0412670.1 DUF418 domain-containing protein [Rhodococcus fascians]
MTSIAQQSVSKAGVSRIATLDVIRGVALCGIIFVNIGPLTGFRTAPGLYERAALDNTGGWLQLLVQQRFFPIFALLFGIGFAMFYESAARRVRRPRLLLLRRLLLLLAIGIPFNVLQPGSALLPLAVVGLAILLPSTWMSRRVSAVAAGALIVGSLLFTGGGISLTPGMLLLGAVLTRYGVVSAIGRSRRGATIVLIVGAVAAIPLIFLQTRTIEMSNFSTESAAAGLAVAAVYVSSLALLMTTGVSRILVAAFGPLGRMALTNYVGAAPLMLAAGWVLNFSDSSSWTTLLGTAGAILLAQWVASVLWLRHFVQGPLEWLWRWGTWGHRQPVRRNATATN